MGVETQVALAWFATYGFDKRKSGELITLAHAKNISAGALFASGVFKGLKGDAALGAAWRSGRAPGPNQTAFAFEGTA